MLAIEQTPDPKKQADKNDTVGNRYAETDVHGLSLDPNDAKHALH